MFRVSVTSPKGQVNEVECGLDNCTIGKGDDNLVIVRGWSVGKKQATIHQKPDGFFVEDHGGIGGTEINGKILDGTYGPLKPEDKIVIGGYRIDVAMNGAAAPAPAAATPVPPAAVAPKPAPAQSTAAAAPPAAAPAAPAPEEAKPPETPIAGGLTVEQVKELNQSRNAVHHKLIQAMDLKRLDVSSMGEDELRETTRGMIDDIISREKLPPHVDRKTIAKAVLDEVVGLGPLEDLLADNAVTEIMVNRFDQIYIERAGKLTLSPITFSGEKAVVSAIERIVSPLGRRIDESSPMVDARLKDGSRVNAVIPPLALKGANITIRKFSKSKLKDDNLIAFGSISRPMMDFMKVAVLQACNIVISGGTGSGKTTLLNVLSNYIPEDERIITVEDAAELQLVQPHVISLEARPANSEGKGAVHIRDLVKNCLRMRPDRIVVGECRGGEALDMLQAMNTGHDGSLTTAHANTPRDCIARLEVMTLMAGLDLPVRAIREQISSAVHVIIQQSRFSDGTRKVTHITEVTGMEGEVIQLQDIFLFKQDGYDEKGKVKGRYIATGNIPDLYQSLQERGIAVDMSVFKVEGRA